MSIAQFIDWLEGWWLIRIQRADVALYRQKSELPESLRRSRAATLVKDVVGRIAQSALCEAVTEALKLGKMSEQGRERLRQTFKTEQCISDLPEFQGNADSESDTDNSDEDDGKGQSETASTPFAQSILSLACVASKCKSRYNLMITMLQAALRCCCETLSALLSFLPLLSRPLPYPILNRLFPLEMHL